MQLEVVAARQLPRQEFLLYFPGKSQLVLDTLLLSCQAEQAGILNHGRAFRGKSPKHLAIEAGQRSSTPPAFKVKHAEELRGRPAYGLATSTLDHRELLQRHS